MLIIIVYNSLEVATRWNYVEQSSGELALACRALKKSGTPRKTLAYRTSGMLITMICNN